MLGAADIKTAMEGQNLPAEFSDQDKLLLVFGYLGPLAIFTLIATRREFVKWHAKQGLILSATIAALYLVLKAIHLVLRTKYFWPVFGDLYWAIVGLLGLGVFLVMLLCIVRALEGERFKVPMLGDLADRI